MPIVIQVSDLKFTTPEGQRVLEDVHLGLERGELVCVVGETSSGKSLLLKLLSREVQPQKGQILVDDRNVTRISKERLLHLRRRIGIVPQNAKPMAGRSLHEALIFKLRVMGYAASEAERKAIDTLEAIRLAGLRELPVQDLSPANQKLFQIALAACHEPGILLIDEPFEKLEFKDAQQVIAGLRHFHTLKRLAILLATRERSLAQQTGGRVVYLHNGMIADTAPFPATSQEPVAAEPKARRRP